MMNRTPEQRARLETLSRELRKVKPEDFAIESFVAGESDKIGCGSTACAIGHCPLIFPDDWTWDDCFPVLKRNSSNTWADVDRFFGQTDDVRGDLFVPESYFESHPDSDVTPSDVADRIDALLAGETTT